MLTLSRLHNFKGHRPCKPPSETFSISGGGISIKIKSLNECSNQANQASKHSAWKTFALHAGKNVRWVSDQLGHADPAFTLRVYAHALREEETDLSFADFGDPRRPNTAQSQENDFEESPNPLIQMARREGFDAVGLRPT